MPISVYILVELTQNHTILMSRHRMADMIGHWFCNRTVAGSIPVHGQFDTPFSKGQDCKMLTMVDNGCPSGHHGGLAS